MRSTGRKFLRISRSVDERKDPLESTRAAARLLKENYNFFGNWPLAITAYNHGREGILRAVAKVGSNDLMEIIRRYRSRSFGFASKNFYAEFLAAVEVAKRVEEFFPDLEYYPPFPLEELEVERTISVAALLKRTDISRSEFLEWNPALSRWIRYIPRGYR
ncbi:MAG: transglycosylase SLT domain-containing protein, partial [Candidatus Binatia bacterium]